jgi:hypothetical protein
MTVLAGQRRPQMLSSRDAVRTLSCLRSHDALPVIPAATVDAPQRRENIVRVGVRHGQSDNPRAVVYPLNDLALRPAAFHDKLRRQAELTLLRYRSRQRKRRRPGQAAAAASDLTEHPLRRVTRLRVNHDGLASSASS